VLLVLQFLESWRWMSRMMTVLPVLTCRYIHTWLGYLLDTQTTYYPKVWCSSSLFHLPKIEFVVRIFCFGMVVACNSILWNFLAKSMDLSSSVDAVVINNAFNFFFTVCCKPF
jgi:hypothetical protein